MLITCAGMPGTGEWLWNVVLAVAQTYYGKDNVIAHSAYDIPPDTDIPENGKIFVVKQHKFNIGVARQSQFIFASYRYVGDILAMYADGYYPDDKTAKQFTTDLLLDFSRWTDLADLKVSNSDVKTGSLEIIKKVHTILNPVNVDKIYSKANTGDYIKTHEIDWATILSDEDTKQLKEGIREYYKIRNDDVNVNDR